MSWKNAPSVRAALEEATRRWPKRSKISDGTIGDAAHSSRKSDHNPDSAGVVHAFDLTHDPANGVDCNALAAHLIRRKDSRVKYIIWNSQICESPNWAWAVYSGKNPHTKHMHVSIFSTTTAENDVSDWWNLTPTTKNHAICYIKAGDDRAFVRAGTTFASTNSPCEILTVSTEADFKRVWATIAENCSRENARVGKLCVFSHASKGGDIDGLEFKPEGNDNGTLSQSEISQLQVLPWAEKGELILASCNSGLAGTRGWAPAQMFARRQKVRTLGMTGFAYFSTNEHKYVVTSPSDPRIYLWAYQRGQNGFFGNGSRMPPMIYKD